MDKVVPITVSEKLNPAQKWAYSEEIGKLHIMVKAGSIVVVIDKVDDDTGDITNKEVVLTEDICVYVENDKYKVSSPVKE